MTRRITIPWLVALLFVALTGATTAVAAPTVAKAITKSQVKKIAKRQVNKAITARAGSLSVASAKAADSAKTAEQASVALSPVAYAVVNPDGTIVASATRGLTQGNVTFRPNSAYCFDVPFTFKTAQVTPVYSGAFAHDVTAAVAVRGLFGVQDCVATEELEVAISVNENFEPWGFIVWFYN